MKIGLGVINTPYTASPAAIARKADELGFESLWCGEHPFIPAGYATRHPSSRDGKIPPFYHQMLDQFVSLSAAAAVTTNIRLATGICLVPERNPLFLAKEVATLDYISGGRFIFGIGAGWLKEEAEILGFDFSRRHSRMTEYIEAMREIWTKDEAEFHGKYIDFPPVLCEPKPIQKPHPPIHIGTHGNTGLRRVAQWADGWCPLSGPPNEQIARDIATLRAMTKEAGRDPAAVEVSVWAMVTEATPFPEALRHWEQMGVDRLVLMHVADDVVGAATYRFDKYAPDQADATLEWLAESALAGRCGQPDGPSGRP